MLVLTPTLLDTLFLGFASACLSVFFSNMMDNITMVKEISVIKFKSAKTKINIIRINLEIKFHGTNSILRYRQGTNNN